MRYSAMAMLVLALGVAAGCTIHSTATDFSGLPSVDGAKPTHINTRNYAVHLFVTKPLLGDATMQKTVADFTLEAKKLGGKKVSIVQSNESTLWYILPPITLLFTPVTTEIAGDSIP